jgi:hypothetical protein
MDSTPQAPPTRTGASPDDGNSRAEAPIHSGLSLFTDTAESAQPYLVSSSSGAAGRAPAPHMSRWTQRIFLVVFVIFCIELGMLLVVLPWLPVWTSNGLLAHFPGLRELVAQNFFRGAMSGIGLLDIWIGIWEAVHYREK